MALGAEGSHLRRRVVSPSLVGRGQELDLLVSAVIAPPAVVIVEGEAGIGKSRLTSELADRPELFGCRWVVGVCRRIREPFPLGPVLDAIRGVGEELADLALSPVAGALRPLLPEIASLLPSPLEPLEDRAAERHRVFRGVTEVLSSLGSAVLVLEDMHWADTQTPELVKYLLADPPSRLSLVLTYRSDEADAAVRALTAKLPTFVGRVELSLAPLDEDQTGALVAAILGLPQVSTEFATYIWERTSGVPFAVEELLALLQARGALVRRRDGWVRRTLDELDVPVGVRAQVLERVSRLSQPAREVAEAAAVLQTPVPAPMLNAAGGVSSSEGGLDEAFHAGVLVPLGDLIGFRHLLASRAVYEAIPAHRRQELHAWAAAALEEQSPAPLGQLAHHLRQAGRLDEWKAVAERAADQAMELGHDEEAARLLEDVLRNTPNDAQWRGRLAVKLARAAIETLNVTGELASLVSEVLKQDLPAAVRGELRFRLALLHEAVGADPLRVRQLYALSVPDLDERPDLKAWAMMGLGIHTGVGVKLSEHRGWVHRVLEVLPDVSPPTFQAFLLGKAVMVLVAIGDPSWRHVAEQLEERTGGLPRHRREVNAFQSAGMAACYAGHYQVAERLLTRALESVVTRGNRKLELRVRSALALLDYCRGRWEALDETVPALLDELTDYPLARADVEVVAASLDLACGRVSSARRQLTNVMRDVAELGSFELAALALTSLAHLTASTGEAECVIVSVREFVAAALAKEFWMPVVRALPAVAKLHVAAGHAAEAETLLRGCASQIDRIDAPFAVAAVPHARGWLASAAGRPQQAADHHLLAAERYELLDSPYEAAQAREQAASCLFLAGDSRAAGELTAALSTYQRLGASWDRDRAASLARQHGMPVAALHRGGRRGYDDQLSPREREVAILAATGRTNKEIARELFLSPKTVEKHVGAALRKLGLRSRSALAMYLDDSAEEATKNGVITP